jgi:3-hydroxybutyryl-CoA dehydrogenase
MSTAQVSADNIRRVLVIGSGTMGSQIAFQCAGHGFQVHLYDSFAAALDTAPERVRACADELVAGEVITRERADEALGRIQYLADPAEAAAEVDIVSESIPEDPVLKGRIFGMFHSLCPERAVFTTNTSTLMPSKYAARTGRPAQFLALHFHQPVWTGNVADVMPHPGTSRDTVETVMKFARRIGQIPIELHKESGSYVFNKMLNAFLGEAIGIAADGITDYKDVDRAWMGIMKTGIGPFGIIDLIGIDLVYHITQYWAKKLFFVPKIRKNARYLKTWVDQGQFGKKSGQGFYQYPDPEFAKPEFVTGP